MEDIFRTYLIETINKRINVIDMYEEEEDKGFDIWEDLIKFFVISGYNEALYKGNVIEITLEGKPDVDWIQIYRIGDRVMIKGESINKIFRNGMRPVYIKDTDEIYFTKGSINKSKGLCYELEFEYGGQPFLLRFINDGIKVKDEDDLSVAIKYFIQKLPLQTKPIPINSIQKRKENIESNEEIEKIFKSMNL